MGKNLSETGKSNQASEYQKTKEAVIDDLATAVMAAFCILNQDPKYKNNPTRVEALKLLKNGAKNPGKIPQEKYDELTEKAKQTNWNRKDSLQLLLAFIGQLSGNEPVTS